MFLILIALSLILIILLTVVSLVINTHNKVKNTEIKIPNEKIIYILLIVILIVGCLGLILSNSESNMNTPSQQSQNEAIDTLHTASPALLSNMKSILNDGYKIVDENKIYYTKSKDYKNVYFIGTLVEKSGQIYPCIWDSNSPDMTGSTDSANDYAIQASGMPDGRKASYFISEYDDGYSRIHQKLLADWN